MEVFIGAAIAGVVIGIFSGLLGIGGGTLMVPLFRIGFGMAAIEATATSLFVIIPTSLAGCIGHIRNKTCVPKLGLAAGIAGACTAPLGVWCASVSQPWLIMLATGVIIAYSALTMLKKALRMPKTSGAGAKRVETYTRRNTRTKEALSAVWPRPYVSGRQLAIGALIGLVAGFASGYVGVGGGFIMIPLFISVLGVSMKMASGTSLMAVVLLGLSGVCGQAHLGNINYLAGIAMTIGSIPGALIGAWLVRFVPERKLRFTFSFFLFFAAAVLVANEVFIA